MPSSALPLKTKIRAEDDWTKVHDPKEKKRIQNRVAQRAYRHRIKMRLRELQSRLESPEARRSQSADIIDSAASLPVQPTTNLDGSMSPVVGATINKPDVLPQQTPPAPFIQQLGLYKQSVDNPKNLLFPHSAHHNMLSSPSPPQPSQTAHGLLSPPTQANQTQHPRTDKRLQDFMANCMRFQSQLLGRLNNLQQETGFPAYQNAMANQMTTAEQANSAPAFTNTEGMNHATFDGSFSIWKAEGLKMQQSPHDMTYFSNTAPTRSSASLQARKPSNNASLNDQVQHIAEQVNDLSADPLFLPLMSSCNMLL